MRPRSAAILACRIMALVFGIQAVLAVVTFLAFAPEDFQGSGPFWAINGTTAVIAFFLWVGAETPLSVPMSRGAPDEVPSQPRSLVNTHAVAFSVVGIVLITQGIPALIAVASSDFGGPRGSFAPLSFSTGFGNRNSEIVTAVVRIVLGVFLIGGAGGLAARLARRYPDHEPPVAPPPVS
jgi:predicted membrane-bound spermidine synthase